MNILEFDFGAILEFEKYTGKYTGIYWNSLICFAGHPENKKVFLAGDFNFDLLKHQSNDNVGNFLQMMLDNSYQPCITEPTRIVNKSNPSLIDNIFSNSVEACISGNLFEKITDHMPSFVIVENIKSRAKPKQMKRRNMKNSDPLHYQADLNLLLQHLRENSHPDDAETAYLIFHEKHNAIINKHYPFEVLTKKQAELEFKPWITRGIVKSTRIKAKLFIEFKKNQSAAVYAKYKFYRDTINSLLRKSKKQYFK